MKHPRSYTILAYIAFPFLCIHWKIGIGALLCRAVLCYAICRHSDRWLMYFSIYCEAKLQADLSKFRELSVPFVFVALQIKIDEHRGSVYSTGTLHRRFLWILLDSPSNETADGLSSNIQRSLVTVPGSVVLFYKSLHNSITDCRHRHALYQAGPERRSGQFGRLNCKVCLNLQSENRPWDARCSLIHLVISIWGEEEHQ
jgi:hypothetical protein